jgi:hypothetical protein
VLVIIDIQDCYLDDEFEKQRKKLDEMLVQIRRRIGWARVLDEPVVNLINFRDGQTLPKIAELISSCKNNYSVNKEYYDGSESLDYEIHRRGIPHNQIELCGVFRDVCVLKTWKGLKALNYNVSPVSVSLTMRTSTPWPSEYPFGYIDMEDRMFKTEEDNLRQIKESLAKRLPKEDEIIIAPGGIIIVDEEGPLGAENFDEEESDSVLCGC